LIINIPIVWTNYFGYSFEDIKAWLTFISLCDIGFSGIILDKTSTLSKVFGASCLPDTTQKLLPNKNYHVSPKLETYQIIVKNGGHTMITYLYFILIRYLYNDVYWNIPFIAMQIKMGVGEKLSFWECLLLAHCNQAYDGYYAMVSNMINTPMRYADLSETNSQSNVLNRLRKGENMNSAFKYNTIDYKNITDSIQKKDYKNLIKILKN
jgi:hypothetical protein